MKRKILSIIISCSLVLNLATTSVFAQNKHNLFENKLKHKIDSTGEYISSKVMDENYIASNIEVKDEKDINNYNWNFKTKEDKFIVPKNNTYCDKTQSNVDELYKIAYKATMNCLKNKDQKSIENARKAVSKLPSSLNWAIGEFSKQIDTTQQVIFVKILNSLKESNKYYRQEDINECRVMINDVIEDEYRLTWSSELDKAQQKKINMLVSDVEHCEFISYSELDLKQVYKDFEDIFKVKYNKGIINWVKNYNNEIVKDVYGLQILNTKYRNEISKYLNKNDIENLNGCESEDRVIGYLKNIKADKDKSYNAGRYWATKTFSVPALGINPEIVPKNTLNSTKHINNTTKKPTNTVKKPSNSSKPKTTTDEEYVLDVILIGSPCIPYRLTRSQYNTLQDQCGTFSNVAFVNYVNGHYNLTHNSQLDNGARMAYNGNLSSDYRYIPEGASKVRGIEFQVPYHPNMNINKFIAENIPRRINKVLPGKQYGVYCNLKFQDGIFKVTGFLLIVD